MQAEKRNLADSLRKVLEHHGYGFQYAVLRSIIALDSDPHCQWEFQVSEFPVSVQGQNTRIDLVLKHKQWDKLLTCECKRVNPAKSDWCFLKAGNVHVEKSRFEVTAERVERHGRGIVKTYVDRIGSGEIFDLGLELRTNERGDPQGRNHDTIEAATTQVLRGLNGMVEFLAAHARYLRPNHRVHIIPVIFTTATICVSSADLGSASVHDGHIEISGQDVTPRPWIWMRYHQTPNLRHSIEAYDTHQTLGDFVDIHYARTIAVVSPSGLKEFLLSDWWTEQRYTTQFGG